MKKTLLLFVCMICAVSLVFSQKTDKEMKKELKEKATKEAQKQAKQFNKEGWKVYPGSLPMDKLIEGSWMKQVSEDENGNPKYITADGNGVAETKSAAEAQAIELGKLQLAGLMETNIASIINGNLANSQASVQEATTVTEIVQSSKNIIAQQLGYVNPAFKIYRDLKDKKIEVQVRLFYETAQSLVIAKKAIKKELKDKLKKTDDEVNKLLEAPPK
ncbi:MAG: hypothetical protein NTY96_12810 [Bacteroidetes bacterium]|nr:hypothetical protein [Bacteroidota bacterium]